MHHGAGGEENTTARLGSLLPPDRSQVIRPDGKGLYPLTLYHQPQDFYTPASVSMYYMPRSRLPMLHPMYLVVFFSKTMSYVLVPARLSFLKKDDLGLKKISFKIIPHIFTIINQTKEMEAIFS